MTLKRTNEMNSIRTTVSVLGLAVLLGACASKVPLSEPAAATSRGAASPTAPAAGGGAAAGTAAATGTPQSQVAGVDLTRGAGAAALLTVPKERVVYFDFDSFAIRDEFRPLIDGHAKVLAANRGKRMVIEGHTDERGGREYNLALGQKRAEAVLRSLALLGAQESQLEAVSFGKERPVAQGANEDAWAKNRRAELKDR
jgi:peptidoglycan-associated lipoprotein